MRKGWIQTTLGTQINVVMGQAPPGKDCNKDGLGIPFVKAGEFTDGYPLVREWTVNPLRFSKSGDTLICVVGATCGKLSKGIDCAIGRSVAALQPLETLDPGFLWNLMSLRVQELREGSRGSAQGVITKDDLTGLIVSLPPLEEQKRIVDLVSSVDSYIDALQRQVDGARTARGAVLHDLLTAGGPDWTESTLGDVAKWGSGGTPKSGHPAYYGGTIPWCVIGDLTEDEVLVTEKTITDEGLRNSSAKIVQSGAVLIAMYGASIGRTGIVGVPMATNQAIAFAYCDEERIDNGFLLKFLQTQKSKFVDAGQGAAQPNISQNVIKDWPITLPPLSEQRNIVEIVSSIDDVVRRTEQLLEDAKNLRSSMLSDLLSGNHEIPESYDSLLEAV